MYVYYLFSLRSIVKVGELPWKVGVSPCKCSLIFVLVFLFDLYTFLSARIVTSFFKKCLEFYSSSSFFIQQHMIPLLTVLVLQLCHEDMTFFSGGGL